MKIDKYFIKWCKDNGVKYVMKGERIIAFNKQTVNKQNSEGYTVLHWVCCNYKDTTIVKSLIKSGANVNAKVKSGWTPLHNACLFRHSAIVRYLIKAGADINAKGYNGWTALHYACFNNDGKLISFLLKNGADASIKTKDGQLPVNLINESKRLESYLKERNKNNYETK